MSEMMAPIALHEASKAALAHHWSHCPYGCNTNHVKCRLGWELIAAEQAAWHAGRTEALGLNASSETDPQPVPHEPCCPTVPGFDDAAPGSVAVGGPR